MSEPQFHLPPVFQVSVAIFFPSPNVRTSSEQLNALPLAHIGVSCHKGSDDVGGCYSEADGKVETVADDDISSFLLCGDRGVCV